MSEKQQKPKFPTKDEIDNAIKNCVDNMFYDTAVFSDNVIKTLFSKEIEDWQSKQDNKKQEPSREKMKEIITESLKTRIHNFIDALKKTGVINEENVKLDGIQDDSLYLSINNGKLYIRLFEFISDKSPKILHVPQTPRYVRQGDEYKQINVIQKVIHNKKSVSIADTMRSFQYNNQKEYDNNKQDNVGMTFYKDEGERINKINLNRRHYEWPWPHDEHLSKITITLKDGNITQITEKNGYDKIISNLSIEKNKVDIEKKIKDIFSNKNDTAMKNILAELDSEQIKCINNIKRQFGINDEEEEKEEKKEEDINNKPAGTNMDNAPRCFGSYKKDGKNVYRCFGCDVPCL